MPWRREWLPTPIFWPWELDFSYPSNKSLEGLPDPVIQTFIPERSDLLCFIILSDHCICLFTIKIRFESIKRPPDYQRTTWLPNIFFPSAVFLKRPIFSWLSRTITSAWVVASFLSSWSLGQRSLEWYNCNFMGFCYFLGGSISLLELSAFKMHFPDLKVEKTNFLGSL